MHLGLTKVNIREFFFNIKVLELSKVRNKTSITGITEIKKRN